MYSLKQNCLKQMASFIMALILLMVYYVPMVKIPKANATEVNIPQDINFTYYFQSALNISTVSTLEEFESAINDDSITEITLTADIPLSTGTYDCGNRKINTENYKFTIESTETVHFNNADIDMGGNSAFNNMGVFYGDHIDVHGGEIVFFYSYSTSDTKIIVSNSKFHDNRNDQQTFARTSGLMVIDNCSFYNNVNTNTNNDGAIIETNSGGMVYIYRSTFAHNCGYAHAGCINDYGGILYIADSIFSGNTIKENSSFYNGGAIRGNQGLKMMISTILAYNKYADGAKDGDVGSLPTDKNVNNIIGFVNGEVTDADPTPYFSEYEESSAGNGINEGKTSFRQPKLDEHGDLSVNTDALHQLWNTTNAQLDYSDLNNVQLTYTDPETSETINLNSSWTIYYHNNDGTEDVTTDSVSKLSSSFHLSTNEPTRPEYRFLGWFEDSSMIGTRLAPGDNYYISNDVAFYAGWIKDGVIITDNTRSDSQFAITSEINDHQLNYYSVNQNSEVTLTSKTRLEFSSGSFDTTKSDGTYTYTGVVGNDITVQTKYTLSFNTNGGIEISERLVSYGEYVSLSNYTPIKEGYKFLGWYNNPEFTGSKITSMRIYNDTGVYAKWMQGDYVIGGSAIKGTLTAISNTEGKNVYITGKDITVDSDANVTITSDDQLVVPIGFIESKTADGKFEYTGTVASDITLTGLYEYSISNSVATITGYNGNETTINIPAKLGGYDVTKIENSAFYYKSSMVSVIIPDSIKEINNYAFYNCRDLKSVIVNGENVAIQGSAFARCSNLTDFIVNGSVQYIGDWAFEDCYNLSNITLPIGNYSDSYGIYLSYHALRDAYSLNNIVILSGGSDKTALISDTNTNQCTYIVENTVAFDSSTSTEIRNGSRVVRISNINPINKTVKVEQVGSNLNSADYEDGKTIIINGEEYTINSTSDSDNTGDSTIVASSEICGYQLADMTNAIIFTYKNSYDGDTTPIYGFLCYRDGELNQNMIVGMNGIVNVTKPNAEGTLGVSDKGKGIYLRPYIQIGDQYNYGEQIFIKHSDLMNQKAYDEATSAITGYVIANSTSGIIFNYGNTYKGTENAAYGFLCYRDGELTKNMIVGMDEVVNVTKPNADGILGVSDKGKGIYLRPYIQIGDKYKYGEQIFIKHSDLMNQKAYDEAISAITGYVMANSIGGVKFNYSNAYSGIENTIYGFLCYRNGEMTKNMIVGMDEVVNVTKPNADGVLGVSDKGNGIYLRPYIQIGEKYKYGEQIFVRHSDLMKNYKRA